MAHIAGRARPPPRDGHSAPTLEATRFADFPPGEIERIGASLEPMDFVYWRESDLYSAAPIRCPLALRGRCGPHAGRARGRLLAVLKLLAGRRRLRRARRQRARPPPLAPAAFPISARPCPSITPAWYRASFSPSETTPQSAFWYAVMCAPLQCPGYIDTLADRSLRQTWAYIAHAPTARRSEAMAPPMAGERALRRLHGGSPIASSTAVPRCCCAISQKAQRIPVRSTPGGMSSRLLSIAAAGVRLRVDPSPVSNRKCCSHRRSAPRRRYEKRAASLVADATAIRPAHRPAADRDPLRGHEVARSGRQELLAPAPSRPGSSGVARAASIDHAAQDGCAPAPKMCLRLCAPPACRPGSGAPPAREPCSP